MRASAGDCDMKRNCEIILFFIMVLYSGWSAYCLEPPQFAELGDFKLESGSVIKGCRLAYRVLGTLNPDKSNVILVPTWFAGTSQELIGLGIIGPSKMIDTAKYYVITVDAIGNGVSSSPSNSTLQPDAAFPLFTNCDMVNAQYQLLTRSLHLEHIFAVIGISMGGMQVFQWLVSYPNFMDKAVSIVGAPWLTSYDLLVWTAEIRVINASKKCKAGNYEAMKAVTPIHLIHIWSPAYRAAKTPVDGFPKFLDDSEKSFSKYNATDWEWQLKAILKQDIKKDFGGSARKAAQTVKAKTLVITSGQDYAVYPGPAREFASLIKADKAELAGDCGHFSFICESDKLKNLVNSFLDK
jgi:homoserine O-acetyltransferase